MRILLIDFCSVVKFVGGTEKVLCSMANAFINKGHVVNVICCDYKKGLPAFYLDKEINFVNLNGTGKELKAPFYMKVKREALRIINCLDKDKSYLETHYYGLGKRLKDEIKIMKPDIIISFDPKSLNLLNLINNKIPVIAMIHTSASNHFNSSISNTLKESYKRCKIIQVLSKSDVALVKRFIDNIPVIYIPNAIEQYPVHREHINYKIIHIGRIDNDSKQQMNLVMAFNKIAEDFPRWEIEFYGEAYSEKTREYKAQILKYIDDNRLNDRIKFMGVSNNLSEVFKYADIFAFPSKFEGMPLALLEAMSSALPAIGYASCHNVNILIKNNVNGFLCDDGIDDFANKLSILMSDEQLRSRLGKEAQKTALEFSPEKIWNEWENVINDVVNKFY